MRVSGGVPRVPSIPEPARTASRVPESQDRKLHFYPPPAHQLLTLSSIEDHCRDWPSLITPIPGGILDSTQQSEQRAGLKTFGCPNHAARTPTAARAYS